MGNANALQIFLNHAAAGGVDPLGDAMRMRSTAQRQQLAQQTLDERIRQFNSTLPIRQQNAKNNTMNAITSAAQYGLAKRKYGNSLTDALEKARINAMQAGVSKLDPAGVDAAVQDPNFGSGQLAQLQRGTERSAARKAGGIAQAQANVGETAYVRKKALGQALDANNPTRAQNLIGNRQGATRRQQTITTVSKMLQDGGSMMLPNAIALINGYNKIREFMSPGDQQLPPLTLEEAIGRPLSPNEQALLAKRGAQTVQAPVQLQQQAQPQGDAIDQLIKGMTPEQLQQLLNGR